MASALGIDFTSHPVRSLLIALLIVVLVFYVLLPLFIFLVSLVIVGADALVRRLTGRKSGFTGMAKHRVYDPFGTSLKYAQEFDHPGLNKSSLSSQWNGDNFESTLNLDGNVREGMVQDRFAVDEEFDGGDEGMSDGESEGMSDSDSEGMSDSDSEGMSDDGSEGMSDSESEGMSDSDEAFGGGLPSTAYWQPPVLLSKYQQASSNYNADNAATWDNEDLNTILEGGSRVSDTATGRAALGLLQQGAQNAAAVRGTGASASAAQALANAAGAGGRAAFTVGDLFGFSMSDANKQAKRAKRKYNKAKKNKKVNKYLRAAKAQVSAGMKILNNLKKKLGTKEGRASILAGSGAAAAIGLSGKSADLPISGLSSNKLDLSVPGGISEASLNGMLYQLPN